jgi:hypothetical protein
MSGSWNGEAPLPQRRDTANTWKDRHYLHILFQLDGSKRPHPPTPWNKEAGCQPKVQRKKLDTGKRHPHSTENFDLGRMRVKCEQKTVVVEVYAFLFFRNSMKRLAGSRAGGHKKHAHTHTINVIKYVVIVKIDITVVIYIYENTALYCSKVLVNVASISICPCICDDRLQFHSPDAFSQLQVLTAVVHCPITTIEE